MVKKKEAAFLDAASFCRLGFAQNVVWNGVGVECGLILGVDYGAEVAFILLDVVVECGKEAFGMNGVHDDARADCGIGCPGQHLCEVEDDFGRAVGYDGQVAVGAVGYFGRHVQFQIIRVGCVAVVSHNVSLLFSW